MPQFRLRRELSRTLLVEGLHYLIPQAPILMLEPRFPLELKVIPRVVDDMVEGRGFGGTSPVVLEPNPSRTLLYQNRPNSSESQRKSEMGSTVLRYQLLPLLLKSRVHRGLSPFLLFIFGRKL